MMGICVGTVTAYDAQTRTAQVRLTSSVRCGDRFHIVGPRTDVEQPSTMLFRRGAMAKKASRGRVVTIGPVDRVEQGDEVFRLVGETSDIGEGSLVRAAAG